MRLIAGMPAVASSGFQFIPGVGIQFYYVPVWITDEDSLQVLEGELTAYRDIVLWRRIA